VEPADRAADGGIGRLTPSPITLSSAADIVAALHDPALVPPDSDDPSDGSTLRLRRAMARFSLPGDHPPRRLAVVAAIDGVDVTGAEAAAAQHTTVRLVGPTIDAAQTIARSVPTETLAVCLGVTDDLADIVADVEAMVRVIGRGEPATADTDAAVDRLTGRFAADLADPVPILSMLYQNFDASAALFATTLLATVTPGRPVPAVPRTRRVAAVGTTVDDRTIDAGTAVTVEIGTAGLPFGAGPHECPGQQLATHIVRGMVAAVASAGYRVDLTAVTCDDDGRPVNLPLMAMSSPPPDSR
jgi:hypothetical protein